MKKNTRAYIIRPLFTATVAVAIAIALSCSSDIEMSPPSGTLSSSSLPNPVASSSSLQSISSSRLSSSSLAVMSSSSSSSSLPIGTVLCSYKSGCIAIIPEDCSALGGQAVQSCPVASSSSSIVASSNSSTTPSSSSSASTEPTYYCDYGLRYTCPSCSGGVGGGCFEMKDKNGECDLNYGRVTTSCSVGLVCDWGIRHYDSSHSECGSDYCGGCYIIGFNNNTTQASCEKDKGVVRTSCPESSLVSGSSSAKVSSSSIAPSSSSRPSSSSSEVVYNDYCDKGARIVGAECDTSNSAGTKDAVCFEIKGSISGWAGSNSAGRKCNVNGGSSVIINEGGYQYGVITATGNGFVYINCSEGSLDYFAINCNR